LASGSLALSRIYDGERPEEELVEAELHAQEIAMHSMEAEYAGANLLVDEPLAIETAIAETNISEDVKVEAAVGIPGFDTSAQFVTVLAEEPVIQTISEPERVNNAVRIRRPSRRAYNYALECLLLGVSAWVLIKTQQSNSRYRSARPSRDRVA
jgi:hypothetical protein